MIEKIKDFLKSYIWPVLGVLAYVFFLRSKNTSLEREVSTLKGDPKLKDAVEELDHAKENADAEEDRYRKLRDIYDRESHGAGGDTDLH